MQSEGNEEEKEDKKVVMENLQRMKYMINQVAKYGKPVTEEKEKINPVIFMGNMLAIIKLFEGAKTIVFKTKFSNDSEFYILASKQELQNAFFNIFKNAVEALGEVEKEIGRASCRERV